MRVAIFGLGYVGCVSAACFAARGHEVIGVDTNENKVEMITRGHSPIVEPGIDELIRAVVKGQRLRATTDTVAAIAQSNLSMICVGTPSNQNGSLELSYVKRVCDQIGAALRSNKPHLVVIRSTMLPGSLENVVIPALETASGKRAGEGFNVALNPEFLREGSSLYDFDHPPFTLIGTTDETSIQPLKELYAHLDAPLIVTGVREAAMIKYACNTFHALKITFANEIGSLCRNFNADSRQVMEILCQDHKLNISAAYLKPGFAFGGSCLPKDLRALLHYAKTMDVDTPLLSAILPSNRMQIDKAVDTVLRSGCKKVAMLGLSFKPGTDDLRESPLVALIEVLIGKGLQLAIYDREVNLARLGGANKEFIERGLPHISSLMRPSLTDTLRDAEMVVIGKRDSEFAALPQLLDSKQIIFDLVPLLGGLTEHEHYQPIC